MSQWHPICKIDDIPVMGARRVSRRQGADVALFRTADNAVFALLDRCPHKAGPLSQGIVFDRHVACPLHNWAIGLDTGCAREPDEGRTPTFGVRLEGDTVLLDLDELNRIALDDAGPGCAGACDRAHAG